MSINFVIASVLVYRVNFRLIYATQLLQTACDDG